MEKTDSAVSLGRGWGEGHDDDDTTVDDEPVQTSETLSRRPTRDTRLTVSGSRSFTELRRRLRMSEGEVKWTGEWTPLERNSYWINVRYRSECIRNTGECYGRSGRNGTQNGQVLFKYCMALHGVEERSDGEISTDGAIPITGTHERCRETMMMDDGADEGEVIIDG
jgi:hypothetical protein